MLIVFPFVLQGLKTGKEIKIEVESENYEEAIRQLLMIIEFLGSNTREDFIIL